MTPREVPERYSRQVRFPGIGQDGQRKLLDSKVTLVGCGALGTVLANALVRAGVGHQRLIDRGFIGSHGQTMTILPGETPCLRCVFEAAPAPGEAGTCETAGVLGPIVNIVASYQAAEAFKILTGRLDAVNRELVYVDVWENVNRRIKIANL